MSEEIRDARPTQEDLEAQAQAEGNGDVKPDQGLAETSEELKTEDGEE